MEGLGVVNHEGFGRRFLEEHGCSERVGKAGRSTCPSQALSLLQKPEILRAALRGLKGHACLARRPDDETEATTFESSDDFKTILAIRSWDELAKDPDLEVAPLEAYRSRLINHLAAQEEPNNAKLHPKRRRPRVLGSEPSPRIEVALQRFSDRNASQLDP